MNRVLKGRIVEHFGTQGDFARAIGVTEWLISRVVNGRETLDPEDQKKWADALESSPEELFGVRGEVCGATA